MPQIRRINAISFPIPENRDLSSVIAPPYDVLDESSKGALLDQDPHNIVAVDLPHLPPKTVGPDATYQQAGETFRKWLDEKVLSQRLDSVIFVYQQTYQALGQTFKRRGLLTNVRVQAFGPADQAGLGGIFPHEQTFSAPKEDRLKLMRATQAQLSPIFGLYNDPHNTIGPLLASVVESGEPTFFATTQNDGVFHEVWEVCDPAEISSFSDTIAPMDTYIADGHHRYNTALNYLQELTESQGEIPETHPARSCLFVLIAMQDPGLVVLPTHRVLGNMADFSIEKFEQASQGILNIHPFNGASLADLEAILPEAGHHAMGLYDNTGRMFIATTADTDPLAQSHAKQSDAWRQLDVAILQHLIVEKICEPHFCNGEKVTWKFPHGLPAFQTMLGSKQYQLGVVMQATPLASIGAVSGSGELMPQKSTFFYPKVATGLAINPLF